MPTPIAETEEQRRRRVSSRIRNELLAYVRDDLAEMGRSRKLPDAWMTAAEAYQHLEDSGYWTNHPHVMARFLSPGACEEVVAKALDALSATHADVWVRAGDQFKPAGRDWSAYAVEKADRIRRDFPEAQRTAFHTGSDGASILFAQEDFHNDPRARQEVDLLRKYLQNHGIPELGFGCGKDGRTWVMVVWSQEEEALREALMDAWRTAFGGEE